MADIYRTISPNDLHVMMTQFLDAAKDVHTAMCKFDDDHVAQDNLNSALQSVLIGAGQVRQALKLRDRKPGIESVRS